MSWPKVPSAIYADQVSVRLITWGKDAAGGRVRVPGGWGRPINCTVAAINSVLGVKDITAHSRESMIVSYVVTSTNRLGFIRDQLLWAEMGIILTIVGVDPIGAKMGRAWNHFCKELPVK